jgi:hypothetical protein
MKKIFDKDDSFYEDFQVFHYDMTWQSIPVEMHNKFETDLHVPSLVAFSHAGSHIFRGKFTEDSIKEWFLGFKVEIPFQEKQQPDILS